MSVITKNVKKVDTIRAARIIRTAEMCRVTTRYVNMVLNGERASEKVFSVYMTMAEEENKLLQTVKALVPFDFEHKSATQRQSNRNSASRNQKKIA